MAQLKIAQGIQCPPLLGSVYTWQWYKGWEKQALGQSLLPSLLWQGCRAEMLSVGYSIHIWLWQDNTHSLVSGCPGCTDPWQRCPQSLWKTGLNLFQGRRVLGSVWGSLVVPFLYTAGQHRVACGREDHACESLLLKPCGMWWGQKGLLCGGLSFTPGSGADVLRGGSLHPHCLTLAGSSLAGWSVTLPLRASSSLSLC